ncbi:MAG: electron transfer flavoprotein subunit alpha/FixB family protein, partial [Desulfobacterales bacterium]
SEGAKDALGRYGARKVVQVTVDGADLSASPDLKARALAAAIEHYGLDALLGLASAQGRDIFARLAAFMDLPLASDCLDADVAAKTVKKSHFSGKTFATVKMSGKVMLCAIRPNAIEAVEEPAAAAVESFAAPVQDPGLLKIVDVQREAADKIDLTEAGVIVTGGRPIASADNYKILAECAKLLGGTIGASRAAVDAGFAPHSMQVGQTGKTVSPRLYIGCGLSGSVQHFAGMKTSKVIVAINVDKDAPIFEKCDYGIIGDLFEVVPVLTDVLKEKL